MILSFWSVQFFPLLHCLACPRDSGLNEGTGVRMKGWNKNAEAGSGETSGERGGNKPPPCSACIVVAFIS